MTARRSLILLAVPIGALLAVALPDAPAGAPAETRPAASGTGERGRSGFDRMEVLEEMARLSGDLRTSPTEALRAHGQRLAELYAALETAGDLPPAERRAVGETILARVAEVGLLLRQRTGDRPPDGEREWGARTLAARVSGLGGPGGLLSDGTTLLLGLLGGLVIAFALGSLAGYRRGTSQASYYGAVGDPRIRFLARSAGRGDDGSGPSRVSVSQLKDMLARGRTVLLQLGYEVKPDMRPRYLELIAKMQVGMGPLDGQHYTVWEDPRHPNRFYELLVCYRPEALERLMGRDWHLSEIAGEIEACRTPDGPVFRRAWWALNSAAAAPRREG